MSVFSLFPFAIWPDPAVKLQPHCFAGLEVKVSSSTFSLGLVSNFCVTSVSSHWNTKHLPHSTRCPSLSRFCKLNLSMNWPSSAPSQRPSRLWWASRTPRTKKSASKSRPLRPSGTALSQTPESSIPNRRSKLQVMTSIQSKLWTFFWKKDFMSKQNFQLVPEILKSIRSNRIKIRICLYFWPKFLSSLHRCHSKKKINQVDTRCKVRVLLIRARAVHFPEKFRIPENYMPGTRNYVMSWQMTFHINIFIKL